MIWCRINKLNFLQFNDWREESFNPSRDNLRSVFLVTTQVESVALQKPLTQVDTEESTGVCQRIKKRANHAQNSILSNPTLALLLESSKFIFELSSSKMNNNLTVNKSLRLYKLLLYNQELCNQNWHTDTS